jgi:hypothetical protein
MPGQKPNFRNVGGKTVPFMADGGSGMGVPAPIGGGAAPPPPPAVDPDQDQNQDMGAMPTLRPESVSYHDEKQECQICANYGQDGTCSLLRVQVSPEGGCSAFEGQGATDEGAEGEPPPDMGEGSGMEGGQQQ